MESKIIPVILAGGGGKRLFPLSTKEKPKYLLRINSDKTLIEEVIERALQAIKDVKGEPPPEILIVANKKQIPHIKKVLKNMMKFEKMELKFKPKLKILQEPLMKNTAPAICYSAIYIKKKYKDAIMLVMPSDHKITGDFSSAVKKGYEASEKGFISTFGIIPKYPETGYGYIKVGEEIMNGVFKAEKFTEKPDLKTAEEYFRSGKYLWNSGIFMFRASLILEELKKFTEIPETFWKFGDYPFDEEIEKIYKELPDISIDYAVCEKSDKIVCVSAEFFWSDIGSFKSIWELYEKDKNRNAGDGLFFESENCLVIKSDYNRKSNHSKKNREKKIVVFGLKNLFVAEGENYILVAPFEKSQNVKKIAEILENE